MSEEYSIPDLLERTYEKNSLEMLSGIGSPKRKARLWMKLAIKYVEHYS